MAIDIRMPKLSDNMTEGTIVRWMKAPGDTVTKGEPLAEVETEKADVELEASESGVLREIAVAEGQTAEVGAVIAVLAGAGEEAGDGKQAQRTEPHAAEQETESVPPREQTAPAEEKPRAAAKSAPRSAGKSEPPRPAAQASSAPPRPRQGGDQPVRISPLARRLAEEAGVNVTRLHGSGPGGRIVKRDVEASVRGPAEDEVKAAPGETGREDGGGAAPAPRRQPEQPSDEAGARAPAASGERTVPASRMRLAIAKRMAEAKRDIPHFYVTAEIDMSEAMHLRESIKRRDAMPGLTVTHLLVRALAIALIRHPRVNASWRDGEIVLHDDANIGVAVAVEDGLVVPVVRKAQTLTLGEIAARVGALTEKARNGKFGGEELTGGTFSLSNVGMLDIEELVAVINPPQAAILAVGAVKDRPIVRDGQLGIAKTMRATLSCDHRVLNGIEGGRFLEELKGILENPVTLLLESA